MRELIDYIAKWIAEDDDALDVQEFRRGRRTVVRLNVAESDMGRIIGREGRFATAMRTLLSISGSNRDRDTSLEIR